MSEKKSRRRKKGWKKKTSRRPEKSSVFSDVAICRARAASTEPFPIEFSPWITQGDLFKIIRCIGAIVPAAATERESETGIGSSTPIGDQRALALSEMTKRMFILVSVSLYLCLEILRQLERIEGAKFSMLLGGRGGRSDCGGHRGNDTEGKEKN